jgi:hypothetical protein
MKLAMEVQIGPKRARSRLGADPGAGDHSDKRHLRTMI